MFTMILGDETGDQEHRKEDSIYKYRKSVG